MLEAVRAAEVGPHTPSLIGPAALSRFSFPGPRPLLACGLGVFCLVLASAAFLTGSNDSYAAMAVLIFSIGILIANLETPSDRAWSTALFVCALAVRLLAVTLIHYFSIRGGGPFLGPDSLKYWTGSSDLVARGFVLDDIPPIYFGSFDVGQYYLFAAGIRFAGADLFALQVLNSSLSALVVPLTFGAVRVLLPRATLPVTAVTAFAPSLISLTSVDLLKDASVMCATAAVVWAVIKLTSENQLWRMALYSAIGLAAGLYLRTSRFYSFAYLELAFVGAILFVVMLAKVRAYSRIVALAAACSIFVAAEVVPARFDWPPSGVMVAATVSYTLGTPSLRRYASGLFDQVRRRETAARPVEPPKAGVGIGVILLTLPVNLFRRMYGPFIWILPSRWNFEALQTSQFFLYPGMVVWYALIPLILVGAAVTGWRIVTRREQRFGLVFIWFFSAVYFTQYCLINLSYRQRDVMLPLLLVFAYLGLSAASTVRGWERWYAAYWALLLATAVTHLAVRAALGL